MKSFLLPFSLAIICCASCTDNSGRSTTDLSQLYTPSFETNGYDTINLVDENGLKQGVWKPAPTNTLNSVVVYRNDTLIP